MLQSAQMTIGDFLEALAAQQPTPGGGGAAAISGAQAAALVSMVIRFTVGKKKYAAVEEEMQGYLVRSEALRGELLALADKDVEAFNAVAATYAMPKEREEEKTARSAAMQVALKGAAEIPMRCAARCLEVMELAAPVGTKGNVNVISDAASALYLANAALLCAIANVNINLKSIQDDSFNTELAAKVSHVLSRASILYEQGRREISQALGVPL